MSEAIDSKAQIEVWDTKEIPAQEAFDYYRESIPKSFVPALPIYNCDAPFRARHEAVLLRDGLFGKISCTPYTNERTSKHCANTAADGYFVVHQIVGNTVLVKGDRTLQLSQGATVILDGREPISAVMANTHLNTVGGIIVPRAIIEDMTDASALNGMALVGKRTPLANCLTLLSDCVSYATIDELEHIYDACLNLLPLELRTDNEFFPHGRKGTEADRLLRRILIEIDNSLHCDISPGSIARQFNISIRYIHKLFLATGTTFSAYVLTKRLEAVYNELRATPSQHTLISSVAYRWGFKDITSFNRAFKKRFGHSPKHFGNIEADPDST